MENKKEKGARGEALAAAVLKKAGYKILERNFRTDIGEIDIIARDGDVIVFAEVKARSSDRFGLPRESVSFAKQRKYSILAVQYMKQNGLLNNTARFDVIDILDGCATHIKNAFDYTGY